MSYVVAMGSFKIRPVYIARMSGHVYQAEWNTLSEAEGAKSRWVRELTELAKEEGGRIPNFDNLMNVIEVAEGCDFTDPLIGPGLFCRVVDGKARNVVE